MRRHKRSEQASEKAKVIMASKDYDEIIKSIEKQKKEGRGKEVYDFQIH